MIQVQDITEVVKSVDIVAKFLADITKTEMSVKDILRRCENRQQDILHEIEFSRLSRREYNLISKELKDVRVERRNAKNLIELLEPFIQNNKYTATELTRLANKVRAVKEEQDSRVYEVKDNNVQRKIASKEHYEILPTENAHKFKVRKRK